MTSRRRFLGLLGGAAVLGTAGFVVVNQPSADGLLRSLRPLPEPFGLPLPIPAVAQARSAADADYYTLVQRVSEVEILPGVRTEAWGYDGTFPGTTLRLRRGRQAVVQVRNELPVPTSTHLHGGVTPPESDGDPMDLVRPGGAKDYVYPVNQPGASLWYHDHRMDFTGPQVWRGLAGMCVVDDPAEDDLGLPSGEYDVPLFICDRSFGPDGELHYPSMEHGHGVQEPYRNGVLGDVILVNGAPWPVLDVAATSYRFRILNASNARRYELALEPGRELVQIGSDVGLLAKPRPHETLAISPAERFDVVVDFSAYPVGSEVTLVNRLAAGATGQVMRFRVARRGGRSAPIPAKLADFAELEPRDAVTQRTFDFRATPGPHTRMWTVNGRPYDHHSSMAQPKLGTVELWRLASDFHHPVHLHLAHFQVASRGGKGPGPSDAGWKDTVDVRPYEVVEVLVRFEGYRGRYMMHCHNLEHEDMAMMANFDVT